MAKILCQISAWKEALLEPLASGFKREAVEPSCEVKGPTSGLRAGNGFRSRSRWVKRWMSTQLSRTTSGTGCAGPQGQPGVLCLLVLDTHTGNQKTGWCGVTPFGSVAWSTWAAWQSPSISALQTTVLRHPFIFVSNDSHYGLWEFPNAFSFGRFCVGFSGGWGCFQWQPL